MWNVQGLIGSDLLASHHNFYCKTSMNDYFLKNYTFCSQQNSFFVSSDYVSTGVHINTSFSVPLSMYGCYCVIKLTPKKLGSAKWALLNAHCWTVVLDIVFNVLALPLMFFPSISGVMLGWGQYIGIPSWFLLYAIQAIVSVFASAAIAFFENRQNALQTNRKIRRKWVRVLLNVINYSVACGAILPPYLETFDIQKMALEALKVRRSFIPSCLRTYLQLAFHIWHETMVCRCLMWAQCLIRYFLNS